MSTEWLKDAANDYKTQGATPITDDIERQRKNTLNTSMDYGLKKSPDAHAQILKSAEQVETPVSLAERNPEEINRLAQHQDLTKRLQDSEFLQRAFESPDFAAVAHDDVDNLMETEGFVNYMVGQSVARFKSAIPTEAKDFAGVGKIPKRGMAGLAGVPQAFNESVAVVLDYLAQVDRNFYSIFGGEVLPGEHWLDEPIQALRGEHPALTDEKLYQMLGAAPIRPGIPKAKPPTDWWREGAMGESVETEAGLQGIESFSRMAVGTLLSVASGRPQEAIGWGMMQEGGEAAKEARESGLDPVQVFQYAGGQALIEGITEKLPMTKLLEDLKVGSSFGKTLAKQMAMELPQEQAATLLQDLNQWMTLRPEATFGDFMAERPSAAYQTMISTIVGTGANVAVSRGTVSALERITGQSYPETLGEDSRAQQALQREATLEAMNRLAGDSKLKARHPGIYQKTVEDLEVKAGADKVYIDGDELFQTLEKANISIDEVIRDVPSIADQIQYVRENGGDFQISLSEYMTKVAGTEIGETLTEHTRLAPEDMSAAEARTWQEGAAERMVEEGKEILEQLDETEAFVQSAKKVETFIQDQLAATGQTKQVAAKNAAVHKAFAVTMASRYPEQFKTPESVYERYGLKVSRETITEMAELEQIPLSEIYMDEEQITLETGETATVQLTAEQAMTRTNDRIDALEQLRGCVGG